MTENYNDKSSRSARHVWTKEDISDHNEDLLKQLSELQKTYEETRNARRAALNLMEDAILSKEALRRSEEKYRTKLEQDVSDRTAELKESKELLQATIDSSLDVIQVFKALRNKEGKIIDFTWVMNNKRAIEQNGDVIGKSLLRQNPGVTKSGVFARMVQVTETGVTQEQEQYYNYEQFDGWFYQALVKSGDGVVMTTRDITEQKKTQQQIKEGKELLQATMDSSMEMIQVFEAVRNEQGEIIDFKWILNNHRSEKIYGDVIGKSLLQNNPGVVEEGIFDTFKKVAETGISDQSEHHYVHEQFNGWFYQCVVKLGDGVATTTTDITERKKAELQLQEKNEEVKKQHTLLKQAEEIAEAGSWEYNINTKEFFWSDGMYSLFNMKKGTPVQPSVYLKYIIDEDKHIGEKIVQHIENNFRLFDEVLRIKSDGKIKTIVIKATPILNEKGEPEKIVGIDRDITWQKNAEEKIIDLNKELIAKNRELESLNTELKTFTSVAANDYKETLKHLYTLFEFIITNDARNLTDAGKANIRRAQSSIQKMKLLTDDIVAYAEIQTTSLDIRKISFSEVFEMSLQKLNRKIEDTDATIQLPKEVQKIKGYPHLLSLLFYHLFDNAIKFRKAGTAPFIEVQYSNVKGSNLDHEDADPSTTYLIVSITDNSIGIDPSEKEKIFTIFYKIDNQGKYKGSGIGLAICKKIMDLHNGFISAESIPENKGTIINCFFPLQKTRS